MLQPGAGNRSWATHPSSLKGGSVAQVRAPAADVLGRFNEHIVAIIPAKETKPGATPRRRLQGLERAEGGGPQASHRAANRDRPAAITVRVDVGGPRRRRPHRRSSAAPAAERRAHSHDRQRRLLTARPKRCRPADQLVELHALGVCTLQLINASLAACPLIAVGSQSRVGPWRRRRYTVTHYGFPGTPTGARGAPAAPATTGNAVRSATSGDWVFCVPGIRLAGFGGVCVPCPTRPPRSLRRRPPS